MVGLGRVPCPEWFDLKARVSKEKSGAVEDCTTDVCHTEFGVRTTDDLVTLGMRVDDRTKQLSTFGGRKSVSSGVGRHRSSIHRLVSNSVS